MDLDCLRPIRAGLARNAWKVGLGFAAAVLLTSRGTSEAPRLPQFGTHVAGTTQNVPCGALPTGTVTWSAGTYNLPINPGNDPFPDPLNPPCQTGVIVGAGTTLVLDAGSGSITIDSSGSALNVAGGTLETLNTDATHTVLFQAAADVASWDGIDITASGSDKGNASLSYVSIQGALRSIQISSGATSSPADTHYGLTVSNSGIGFSYFDGIDAVDTPISVTGLIDPVTGLSDGKTGTINNIGSIAISSVFDSSAPTITADALHVDGMTFGSSAPFGVSACPSNQPCYIGNQAIMASFVPHAHQPVSVTNNNFYRAGTYGVQLDSANQPSLTNNLFVCNGLGIPTTGTPCSGSGPVYSAVLLSAATADLAQSTVGADGAVKRNRGFGNGLDAIVFNGTVTSPTLTWQNATNDAATAHTLGYLLNGNLEMTGGTLKVLDGGIVKSSGTIDLTGATLDARGAVDKVFTSLRDPIGIDSCHSVLVASCPTVLAGGEWGGINLIGAGSNGAISHARILYAGTGVRISNGATSTLGSTNFGLTISSSAIGPTFADGVNALDTPILVSDTTFGCPTGVCTGPSSGDHGITADFTGSTAAVGGGLRVTGATVFNGSVNDAIKGIALAGQTVDIEGAVIDRAGAYGIQLQGADHLTLLQNTVTNSGTANPTHSAIYLNGVSNADFNTAIHGNVGSGNGLDAIAFHGATGTSLTWQTINNSTTTGPLGYLADNALTVHGNLTLNSDYVPALGPITVTGGGLASTASVLTSLRDSTVNIPTCGSVFDPKVSGLCVRPAPGDWGGLTLDSGYGNNLSVASELRYATTGITMDKPGIATPLTLSASNIRNTSGDGIATKSPLSISGGSFTNIGGRAFNIDLSQAPSGPNLTITGAAIFGTSQEGILAAGLAGQQVDIETTRVSHAGATGINLVAADHLTLAGNTVTNSAAGFPAIYLNGFNGLFANIHDNTGAGNGLDALAFHGTVTDDLTWVTARKTADPTRLLGYLLDGDLNLARTLTVGAADIVKISNGRLNLGHLQADGTSNDGQKIFTSLADNAAGVQACPSALLPGCAAATPGDWGGISLASDGAIVNGAIRYATTGIGISGGVGATFGSSSYGLVVSRSRFDSTKNDAIDTIGTPVSLTDSSINGGIHGVNADFSASSTAAPLRLSGNHFTTTSAEAVLGQGLAAHPVWITDNHVQGAATFGVRLVNADALVLRNNNVSASGTSLITSGRYPAIYLSKVTANFARDVRGNVGAGNGLDAIVMDGTAVGDLSWITPNATAPTHPLGYLLDGALTVQDGTLTAHTGDVVKARGGPITIKGGSLQATGATFTSLTDAIAPAVSCPSVFTTFCGPAAGDWGGLVITEDAAGTQGTATITGSTITYAETAVFTDSGPIAASEPAITLSGDTISNTSKDGINSLDTPIAVDHNTITSIGSHGIIVSFLSPANCPGLPCDRFTVTNSQISGTVKDGIVANGLGGQPVTITGTTVTGAGTYGIRLVGADTLTVTDNTVNNSGTTTPTYPALYMSGVTGDFNNAITRNLGLGNGLNALVFHGTASNGLTWITPGSAGSTLGYMLDGPLTVNGNLTTTGVVKILTGAIKVNGVLNSTETAFTSMKNDTVGTPACSTVLVNCSGGPTNSDWNGINLDPVSPSSFVGGSITDATSGLTISRGEIDMTGATITNIGGYALQTTGTGSAQITCTGIHGNGGGLLDNGAASSIDNSDLYGNASTLTKDLDGTTATTASRVWWGTATPTPVTQYNPATVTVNQPLPQQAPTVKANGLSSVVFTSDNTNSGTGNFGKGTLTVTLTFDRTMNLNQPLTVNFSSLVDGVPHAVIGNWLGTDKVTWVGHAPIDGTNLTGQPGLNTLKVASGTSCMRDGTNVMAPETAPLTLDFTTATVDDTAGANHVGAHSATVNGVVNPLGWSQPSTNPNTQTYAFVEAAAFGTPLPDPATVIAGVTNPSSLLGYTPIGDGNAPLPVSQTITGLAPTTTYHYAVVAVDLNGITVGSDQQFTTTDIAKKLLVVGNPTTTAGDQYNFTVTAKDGPGNSANTVDDYTGTVAFSLLQADTQAALPLDYTFKAFATPSTPGDDGTQSFSATLTKATNQAIVATDSGTPSIFGHVSMTVNPAAASKLVVGQQPTDSVAGVTIAPAVTVLVEDQFGNVEMGDLGSENRVTVGLTSGSPTATLLGTKKQDDVAGMATFNDLSIQTANSGYALHATSGTLTAIDSGPFNITPAALDHLVLTPTTATILSGANQTYTTEGFDQYGNSRGDVSLTTHLTITPDGSCTDATSTLSASCTATIADSGGSSHTVTGTLTGKTGTATLTVNPRVAGAPTGVSATPGDTQATVSWTAPADDGGSPITKYTVTSSPDNKVAVTPDGSTLTATVTGLTNGTAYTFTVVATNVAGDSSPSTGSSLVTPRTVPGAPTGVTATPANASATVSWSAPADNGGSPITKYTVTSSPDNQVAMTADGNTLTATVTGLTNGTLYTFTVVATNAAGDGSPSAASSGVTPTTTAPGAPTVVTATPGDTQATVSWTAPADDGGSPITKYTVTSSPDNKVAVTPDGSTLTATVTGLTNGTPYTFTVVATNAIGDGSTSMASSPVTPRTVPGAPTAVTASPGDGQATVSWTAPADNGGSAITSYTVTASPGGAASTVSGSTLTTAVSGLTNGTDYTFTVVATNVAGNSVASTASTAVTAGAPEVPGSVSASGAVGQATVNWTVPADNGTTIDHYTVTPYKSGVAQTPVDVPGASSTTVTITGLAADPNYTFQVTATNSFGTSPIATSASVIVA